MSVVGTVPWRLIAARAWSIATAHCSEQKDIDKLIRHLETPLKPLVRIKRVDEAGRTTGWKLRPRVKGEMGQLTNG